MTIANFNNLPKVQHEEMVVNCADEDPPAAAAEDKYDEVPPEEPSFEQQRDIIRDATRAALNCSESW